MDRRKFVGAFGSILVIARSGAGAQPAAKIYRIGYFTYATAEQSARVLGPFTDGLRELGYVDGRNLVFEQRYGDGRLERLPDLAADLVRSRVEVIVTGSNPIALAAKRATATIPIVMVGVVDPVGYGLVANLARPGGNITGFTSDASTEVGGKSLGLLREILPGLSRVTVLRQIGYGNAQLEAAARKLNITINVVEIRTLEEIAGAFASISGQRVDAVIITGAMFYVRRQQIADLALKYRLPAFHSLKEYAEVGLLLTYGANLEDLYRRAAGYVDRILKGAKPGDLPVEQPTKFELVINLKTAKALGLMIPQSLLLRADEVIR
jgi:putative ABC transport system substrate-binding protein